MKTFRYLLIGFSWIPLIALAAWWAGFMPFPTRPEETGVSSFTSTGLSDSGRDFRTLITAREAREKAKELRFGMGQWACDPDNRNMCYFYDVQTAPFYGLGSPSWMLSTIGEHGELPLAFYGSYGACELNRQRRAKASEADRVGYERWATEQHQKIEPREYEPFYCHKPPVERHSEGVRPRT